MNCLVCDKEFNSYNGIQKYCSKKCKKDKYKIYFAERFQRLNKTEEFKSERREQDERYRKTPQRKLYNNEYKRKEHADRMKNDPLYLLRVRYRTRVKKVLKTKQSQSVLKYCGCSLEKLKEHIEKQFIKGMTWKNRNEWHIDHIKPLASAKNEEEIIKLCHYTNLQPLWAIDNLRKGAKY